MQLDLKMRLMNIKEIFIKHRIFLLFLFNLLLVVLCGFSIFSFMSKNIHFQYDLISRKINYLILMFNIPALATNVMNVIYILKTSKNIYIKLLILCPVFVLLFISFFFMQAWCVLNTIY